jgi:hypothetical protein
MFIRKVLYVINSHYTLRVLTVMFCMTALGCGARYVRGTQIEFSKEKQQIADIVERYRVAVEQRDSAALRKMASVSYYENASTTTIAADDYDFNGLEKVFADLKNTVKTVKYKISVTDISVIGQNARVDFEYESQYLLALGEQDRWATKSDKNRLTFRLEEGEWRIIGGM